MAIGEDLRAFLLADPSIASQVGARIHQNHAPQDYNGMYIWFRQSASDRERSLGDAAGEEPFYQFFDVECISEDLDEADNLGELLVSLDGRTNVSFGSSKAQVVNVGDAADGYEPRGIGSDTGRHFKALECEVVGYSGA